VSDGPDQTPAQAGDTVTEPRTEAAEGPIVVSPSVYRRLTSGFPGFAAAMLSCLVIVGLVLLLTPNRDDNAVHTVPYTGELSGLQVVAPYAVQAPEGLPAKWYATSSRLSGKAGGPIAWHLGFYTPLKQYAALEESNETAGGQGGFIDRMTSQGRPDGSVQIAGATWNKTLRKDKNQRSLVRSLPGVTLVVSGTASYDELAVLAGSLKAHPKPSPAPSQP
jgi:hypothetical protein